MPKKPFLNAVAAAAYIVLVVFIMSSFVDRPGLESTLFVPIAMLSLFTLSAAVMGYLFLSQPIQMYLAGEKKQAVTFFLHTVAGFAVITAIFLAVMLSRA
jgi:hypothetical protein